MATFGEWLHEQRSLRKLTREAFATRVGCSVSALRKIEYGERRPSAQIAELMANCLDVPSEERSTFVRVARGELSVARLVPESRPVATTNVSPPKTHLPIFPTPLIGRERELEQLSQLLGDPQCRLLTLVGPGGIGKTRLAIEAASNMQDVFTDGVYFVPLAFANSTRFIVPVIADAVGFSFHHASHADPKTQLFGYLKEKQVLLLPDNLEQLLTEPGIELLAELLGHAPKVKVLATSRECLGLQYEWVFEVQGLPVPESINAARTVQNTSVELFLQRTRRAYVGFNATPEDFPAIVRICQLMDGNPLGIELAAAWVRTLSCDEIAQEIEGGLDFLSVSAGDLPARHRSMRAVFDHSWKLLTEEEQRVLLRLAVFRGGFRREAAGAVAGATLSVLSSLVTKSLVRRSGAGRYDLHELIRQYAAERLAEQADEQDETQARHARYYLIWFREQQKCLYGASQREALAELTADIDNLRLAWSWASAHGELVLLGQAMRVFASFHDIRGWLDEGLSYLRQAVEVLEPIERAGLASAAEREALGRLLACQGVLLFRQGNQGPAQAVLERSLALLRPLAVPEALIEPVMVYSLVNCVTGNLALAHQLMDEALALARASGDQWFTALCLTNQGVLSRFEGRYVEAYERSQAGLAAWRTTGDPRFTAMGANLLSLNAVMLKRYAEAEDLLQESLALNSSLGDRWGLGTAYRSVGRLAAMQGDYAQARNTLNEALEVFIELGAQGDAAQVLGDLGWTLLALGDTAQAEGAWLETLRIAIEGEQLPVGLEAVLGLASLRVRSGDKENAFELLLMTLDHPASLQETKDRASDLRAELEAQLTPAQIEAIRARSAEKTFEAVVGDLLN